MSNPFLLDGYNHSVRVLVREPQLGNEVEYTVKCLHCQAISKVGHLLCSDGYTAQSSYWADLKCCPALRIKIRTKTETVILLPGGCVSVAEETVLPSGPALHGATFSMRCDSLEDVRLYAQEGETINGSDSLILGKSMGWVTVAATDRGWHVL